MDESLDRIYRGANHSLKTTPGGEANSIVFVPFRTYIDDGGGGIFAWDMHSTDTDNEGTVFAVDGVATGRWKRVFSGPLDVRWFGARQSDGSGLVAAVAAAVAALKGASADCGGTIYIPAGVWYLTDAIELRRFHGLLTGAGNGNGGKPGTIIVGPPNAPAIRMRECTHASVRDLRIFGHSTETPTTAGIELQVNWPTPDNGNRDTLVNTDCHFENIKIGGGQYINEGSFGGGLRIQRGIYTTGDNQQNDQSTIRNCSFQGLSVCAIELTAGQNTHWRCENIVINSVPVGIRPQGHMAVVNCTMSTVTTACFENAQGADSQVDVAQLSAEGCAMLYRSFAGGAASFRTGYFQAYRPTIPAGGEIIEYGYGGASTVFASLSFEENFGISQDESPWTGPAIKIKVRNCRWLGRFEGWDASADFDLEELLDLTTATAGETRTVEIVNRRYSTRWHWTHGDAVSGVDIARDDRETITTRRKTRTVTTTATVANGDGTIRADATGGAFDVTLPTAVGRDGMRFTVIRVNGGGNAVTVKSAGGTINGVAAGTGIALSAQYQSRTYESDGTNWEIVEGLG